VWATCHSNHEILKADSSTFKLAIDQQCGKCHEELLESYWQSYHGKVNQLGYKETAKCSDCHENHLILKVTDPMSSLSDQNRLKTCRKCHPKATKAFADYKAHAEIYNYKRNPILFYVTISMESLLLFTFAFFGLHTVHWLSREISERKKHGKRKK